MKWEKKPSNGYAHACDAKERDMLKPLNKGQNG